MLSTSELARELSGRRFHFVSESELQEQIEAALKELGVAFVREFRLTERDRPDFWIPSSGTVVEVKIKGATAEVRRQVVRYSRHPEVKEIMLVTSRRQHQVEGEINGCTIRSVNLWTL